MKLNGFFLTLCVLTLFGGCADDSATPESRSAHAIEFSSVHVNNISRNAATDIPFTQFNVYGFADSPQSYLYDGAVVNRTSDGKWVCEQTEYWYPGHDYWFSAIAPAFASGVNFTKNTVPSHSYQGGGTLRYRPSENGATIDLLYAFSGRITTPSTLPSRVPPVEFEFEHLLSQIRFMFYNDLGNPHYFINVPSITLGNIYAEGTIDLTQSSLQWERSGWDTFWTGAGRVDFIKVDAPKTSTPLYLLPIRMDGAIIQLQTQLFYVEDPEDEIGFQMSDVKTFSVDFPEIDFKPGHSYTLTARLNHTNIEGPGEGVTPISFEIQDHGWHYTMNPIDVPEK